MFKGSPRHPEGKEWHFNESRLPSHQKEEAVINPKVKYWHVPWCAKRGVALKAWTAIRLLALDQLRTSWTLTSARARLWVWLESLVLAELLYCCQETHHEILSKWLAAVMTMRWPHFWPFFSHCVLWARETQKRSPSSGTDVPFCRSAPQKTGLSDGSHCESCCEIGMGKH